MRSQRFEIDRVRREDRSTGFGGRHDQGIDHGATACQPAQLRSSACKLLRNLDDNVTTLEKPVLVGITARVALKALDQNDRGNAWWPEARITQRRDEYQGLLGMLGEFGDPTRIENKHVA